MGEEWGRERKWGYKVMGREGNMYERERQRRDSGREGNRERGRRG
jgi:hypothetical protein